MNQLILKKRRRKLPYSERELRFSVFLHETNQNIRKQLDIYRHLYTQPDPETPTLRRITLELAQQREFCPFRVNQEPSPALTSRLVLRSAARLRDILVNHLHVSGDSMPLSANLQVITFQQVLYNDFMIIPCQGDFQLQVKHFVDGLRLQIKRTVQHLNKYRAHNFQFEGQKPAQQQNDVEADRELDADLKKAMGLWAARQLSVGQQPEMLLHMYYKGSTKKNFFSKNQIHSSESHPSKILHPQPEQQKKPVAQPDQSQSVLVQVKDFVLNALKQIKEQLQPANDAPSQYWSRKATGKISQSQVVKWSEQSQCSSKPNSLQVKGGSCSPPAVQTSSDQSKVPAKMTIRMTFSAVQKSKNNKHKHTYFTYLHIKNHFDLQNLRKLRRNQTQVEDQQPPRENRKTEGIEEVDQKNRMSVYQQKLNDSNQRSPKKTRQQRLQQSPKRVQPKLQPKATIIRKRRTIVPAPLPPAPPAKPNPVQGKKSQLQIKSNVREARCLLKMMESKELSRLIH